MSVLILTTPAWKNSHGRISFSCNKKESEMLKAGSTYAIIIAGRVEEADKMHGRVHIETKNPISI